jgi:integrating conjugative element protein (TIGR03749 family)
MILLNRLLRCIVAIYFILICWLLLTSLAFADSQAESKNDLSALTLTQTQIKKLDKLFDIRETNEIESSSNTNTEPSHTHVIWKQTPIVITLPINQEKIITFPSAVEFGYDKQVLPEEALRVQNNQGILYLLAKQIFSTQRVMVKLQPSGTIILLDLSAEANGDHAPLDVVLAKEEKSPVNNIALRADESPNELASDRVDYVGLMRFAVQQLYAPKRLLTVSSAIYRVPMRSIKTVPLLRDGSVIAMPLASWQSGHATITAVLLRNMLEQPIILDPRSLCGEWLAATFYPRDQLSKRGELTSSTTVFLIAQQPFKQAIQWCN